MRLFQNRQAVVSSQSTSLVVLRPIQTETPLLPLFNKAAMRLPLRIAKWAMGMQDVDLELIYEPGNDDADPPDFL